MKKLLFFIALIFIAIFSNAQCPNPSGRLINYGIEIIWEDDNSFDPITLYYSKDGDFTNGSAYYGVKSPFLITQYNDFNFIRLGRNNNYSEIIVFKLKFDNFFNVFLTSKESSSSFEDLFLTVK